MNQMMPSPYPPQQQQPGQVMPVDPRMGGVPDYYRQGGAYPYYPGFDQQEETPQGFDFYKYLRILNKYRWLIAACLLTSMLLGAVFTFLSTPIYRATISLQIDRESMNIVKVEGVQPNEQGGFNPEFFQTQYELLASRTLAERVVSTLGLANDQAFNANARSPLSYLKEYTVGRAVPKDSDAPSQEIVTRNAAGRLSEIMNISPVRGSRIVKLSIDHPNPEVAQRVANGFGDVFIADNLDRRFEATSYARKFLEERLQQLKQRLEETEKQLVTYAEEQGIIQLDGNKSLSSTDLEATNIKLAEVRADRIKKELLWKQAQATDGLGLKEILDSEAIQANRKLRTELAAEYQQKLAVFKPAFPDMIKLRNQIKELDRQVQSEVSAIKQSIEAGYLAAKEEEETLLSALEGTKTEVVEQRNRSIQYNILQREVDTNRQLYDGLLQRYKEIGVAGGVGTNNISIVDAAAKPIGPRSPRMLLNLAVAFLAGLGLGVLLALGLDYLDDSFKAPEDIEREIGLSVVGVIPKPQSKEEVEDELLDPRSAISEAYRSLRTGLQFATSDGLPRSLLITSSKPSEGKTTSTISLARSLAQIGLEVLLIDGDLRNASVHKRMFASNEQGLSNYLSGAKKPEEVVQSTDTNGLVLMTAGPLPPNPAELLSGPRFRNLMMLAAESFDIVLIDGPPIMGLADAPLISTNVQATLLVVAANETRRSVVKVALKRLQMARANIVGAVLNKFDSKQTGYGYGYGYGDYDYHSYGTTPQLPSAKG
jgi:polysaccharide biosynthesis transport protein